MANMLTTKELTLLVDLLTYEENATKKARLYSRTMTDPTVSQNFSHLADNHQKRFCTLLNLLQTN